MPWFTIFRCFILAILNYFVGVVPVCFEIINTEIGQFTCLCFSTFAWPYLINNTIPLLPAPPITGSRMLKWQWKAQVIFCAGGRYRAVKVSREQAISEVEKTRGVGHSFQTPMALGHSREKGGSLQHAGVTCGCPQANHCLVEGGNWSQQTLPSDFTPHSFGQTLLGPLQPWLGSPGCSAPSGCSSAQKAARWHLSAADRIMGMN